MLDTCNTYASGHSITFNADKTSYIAFRSAISRIYLALPQFYIDGKPIEYVASWPHLGTILEQKQTDSERVSLRCRHLIDQINDVICTFGNLDPVLRQTYCKNTVVACTVQFYVIYNLTMLFVFVVLGDPHKKEFGISHIKHRALVFAVGGRTPLHDKLCRRILNFHLASLRSRNNIIEVETYYFYVVGITWYFLLLCVRYRLGWVCFKDG
jgi:UDP-2,3-diacylglucosamine pyrophosphatase LpxH